MNNRFACGNYSFSSLCKCLYLPFICCSLESLKYLAALRIVILIFLQLDISRRNLGLETIDIYYVHNPEIEMSAVPRQTILSRLRKVFIALEKAVADGKISMYGVSSWNAFRTTSGSKNYLSLEELVKFAKEAAGKACLIQNFTNLLFDLILEIQK